jgi:predicted acyl esterase
MQMDSDVEELSFTHIFDSPAHIVGSARAKLFMSCPDHNDLDVWVQLRKADKEGHLLHQLTIPPADLGIADDSLRYLGPSGALRASYRAIEPKTSTLEFPEHDYYTQNLVEPGRVVELEIGLWQTGMAFEAGERLILKISGHPMTLAEYPQLRGKESLDNKGFHRLHMGGEHPSSITIPLLAL